MQRAIINTILVTMAISWLAGCNLTSPPPTGEAKIVLATETPIIAPTFTATRPRPTATPTQGPPTPTATRVVVTPTARPTTTTPASPEAELLTHIVTPNDTLSGISLLYDVPLADLLALNGLAETDFLQPGQAIIVPLTSSDTVAAGPTTAETGTVAETSPPAAAKPAAAPPVSAPPPPAIDHAPNINPLTGLPVDDPAILQRRPLLVRIGNDVGARQGQVGLNQADVVYEEITEWWVTRFTAIFLANTPNTVSPVRSARLINVQLAPQYQGALAHSGGSDGVRWEISQAPITNLDEYYHRSPYFYRPNEGWQTRLAIDAEAARNYIVAKGLDAPVRQNGFLFSDTPAGGEPGQAIFIPYPSATSFSEWRYDAASGAYLRWINGAPLVDAGDGQQVAAANVIVYFAEHQPTEIVEDSNGATSIRIIINGSGPAWLFRDGRLSRGDWQSDGATTPYFRQADGSPYALKPGHTWIEVVPTSYTIGLNSAAEAKSR